MKCIWSVQIPCMCLSAISEPCMGCHHYAAKCTLDIAIKHGELPKAQHTWQAFQDHFSKVVSHRLGIGSIWKKYTYNKHSIYICTICGWWRPGNPAFTLDGAASKVDATQTSRPWHPAASILLCQKKKKTHSTCTYIRRKQEQADLEPKWLLIYVYICIYTYVYTHTCVQRHGECIYT